MNGKVCYLEMPATSIDASERFYAGVFGWNTRVRGDGSNGFDDATGGVSGTWTLERKPSADPAQGILVSIMVDDVDATLQRVSAGGGRVVASRTDLGPTGEAYATFLDPAGNLLSLYQEGR